MRNPILDGRWFYILRLRLRSLFRREAVERELEDEFREHLERRIEQELARGVALPDARRIAMAAMDGMARRQDECRDVRRVSFVEDTMDDLRYAHRAMGRSPGYPTVAVASLALAIAANSAVFGVVDALLFRSLPVEDPAGLVVFKRVETDNRTFHDLPYPVFERLRSQPEVLTEVTANWPIERTEAEATSTNPGTIRVGLAAGNYFSTLGVGAVVGRTLTPDDNQSPGGHPLAVISHAYWQRRFLMSREIVGQTLHIAGTAFTIVGVTSQGFSGEWAGRPIDIWVPFMMASQVMPEVPGGPSRFPALLTARLKPGVSREQAQAFSQLRYEQALTEPGGGNRTVPQARGPQRRIMLESAATGFSMQRASLVQPLAILALMVGLGLLAVCVSLANLALARAEAREREIAVRQALGAGRSRIVRQLLTEGLLLAGIGAALAAVLVYWNTGLVSTLLAAGPLASGVEDHSLALDVRVDGRFAVFAAILSILVTALFGLAPALRAARISLIAPLKERGVAAVSGGRFSMARGLVIAQVAMTLVLVVGAGLLLKTLHNLRSQDVGFERERLLLVWAAPARTGRTVPALANLAQRVHSQISTLPGVVSASVSSGGVLDGGAAGSRSENLQFEGQPSRPGLITHSLAVSPGFFSTVGMQVIRGRGLEPRDADRSAPVAVISESMAAFFFPGVDPVGRRFGPAGERGYPIEIVGVVKDAKAGTPRDQRAAWYFPYQQNARFLRLNWCIAVRTAGSPMSAAPGVQQALREIEPNLAILRVNTVEGQLDHILARERMITTLSSLLAILAVLLSCLGLYGLISLRVVRRTSEIGIRLALGATPGSVLRLVIGESMLLVLGGIIAGLPLAMALKRFLATWLFGVDGADPTILVATAGLMLVVAISAAFVPALRVNRIDPAMVLRNE